MKKIFLTSCLLATIACPSFANIDKDASTATCDNATIGTTTGPANLEADWTANTINLDFYSEGEKVGTGQCTYDGAITLPSTPEVPTGYTFGGWKLRTAAAPAPAQCWEITDETECLSVSGCDFRSDRCAEVVESCTYISILEDCSHYFPIDTNYVCRAAKGSDFCSKIHGH